MEAKAAFDMEADNFGATELRLGLPGTTVVDEPGRKPTPARACKRTLAEAGAGGCRSGSSCCTGGDCDSMEGTSPPAKAQVVGWPPIRSYRKNCALQSRRNAKEGEVPGLYVKVGMDGAPYLRKIDLNMVGGYKELRAGLEAMFECFSIGFSAGEGRPASDYAITYEDKDGDWMLAGDVPWEMFTSSCRRLRIMKGSEARGFGSSSLLTNS